MLKRAFPGGGSLNQWRKLPKRHSTSDSSAVESILLRFLKQQYRDVSKMVPPPKMSPPSPFSVVEGAIYKNGPVLHRFYGKEEINISVTPPLANSLHGDEEDDINQLYLHVDVSKPDQEDSLHFICGIYPDTMGIHSVFMRRKPVSSRFSVSSRYQGPVFQDLEEKLKDELYGYIEERGINECLFPFLHAWLYVKDHRILMRWFKTVGTFINERTLA